MSRFPPTRSVLCSVKMTRTAYAQLVGQKFFPPKIFGSWTEKDGTNERRWRDVGMKIVSTLTLDPLNTANVFRLVGLRCSTRRAKDAVIQLPPMAYQ